MNRVDLGLSIVSKRDLYARSIVDKIAVGFSRKIVEIK